MGNKKKPAEAPHMKIDKEMARDLQRYYLTEADRSKKEADECERFAVELNAEGSILESWKENASFWRNREEEFRDKYDKAHQSYMAAFYP